MQLVHSMKPVQELARSKLVLELVRSKLELVRSKLVLVRSKLVLVHRSTNCDRRPSELAVHPLHIDRAELADHRNDRAE